MKIALINENSQKKKNSFILDVLEKVAEKYGHQVLDKLEQEAPQKVEHSVESDQAQSMTDKAA